MFRRSLALAFLLTVSVPLLGGRAFATQYFVSTTGSDSAAGDINHPLATIQAAIQKTVPGDTVYIRAGTYYQQIQPASGGGSAASGVTVQPYNNESVTISGADPVSSWTSVQSVSGGEIWSTNTGWLNEWGNPVNNQEVFLDGAPLQQIGTPPGLGQSQPASYEYPAPVGSSYADLAPGRFFYDTTSHTLYICLATGVDPTSPSHTVMAARRIRMLFFPNSTPQYITFQNLKFRYSNWTSVGEMGCAVSLNPNCAIRNCDVQWCDFGGIGVANNCVVDGCTASNNGDSGIVITGATGWVVKNCKIQNNNWRSFNPTWHAGGIKEVGAGTYGRIENCEASGNYGQGIWLDTCNGGLNVVRNNYVHNNGNGGSVAGQPTLAGIMIENTTSANIENNVVANNSDLIGIYISGSNSTNTFNNTVAYNGVSGGTQAAVEVNVDEGSGRTLENNAVRNNIFYNNVCAYDVGITTGPTANNIYGNTADYNLYYRSSGAFCCTMDVQDDPTYPYGQIAYSLSSWQALGLDAHGKNVNPAFNTATPTTCDYSLSSASPARGAGTMSVNVPWDYYWQPRSTSSMDMGAIAYGSGRIYEAESGTLAGGAAVYTDSGCSNGARVGNFNLTNASDTWSSVDGAGGGDWALTFTYSSASGASKGLYVNGTKVATPSFLNTGGWGSGYQTALTTVVALASGTNALKLMNDSATNGVDIDKIDAAPAIVTYEAESGAFTGGAGVYADAGCSNGARVGGLSQTNASVTWNNVTVSAAGSHTLTVIYSDAATFNKGLYVNGTKVGTLSLTNTGGVGSAYQRSVQTAVTLNAGTNTIAIKNDTNTGPDDIDAIIVSN